MNSDDLDRVLANEPEIVPSPGFVSSVMEAVTAEAIAPPLPFPWRRAWPLAAGQIAALVWLIALRSGAKVTVTGPDLCAWFEMMVPMAKAWVAAGLAMSVAVTAASLAPIAYRRLLAQP